MLQPEEQTDRSVNVYLGEQSLIIPSPYFRFQHAQLGGKLPEIDLAADAGTFRPAKLSTRFRPGAPDGSAGTIYLTLAESKGKLGPAERTTRLYSRFLQADQWNHPGGLIKRRFEKDSPYQHEDLYMTPPEGRRFAARCRRPKTPPDALPSICLADLRFNGIDIRMRFSASLLPEWEKLYSGTRGLVNSFRQ